MNYLFIQTDRGLWKKIIFNKIIFIQYFDYNCLIRTSLDDIIIRNISLTKLLALINQPYILHSSKSYAININYIKSIKKLSSSLWNISFFYTTSNVPLSKLFKKDIFSKLNIK